jgi:hypothetical protein
LVLRQRFGKERPLIGRFFCAFIICAAPAFLIFANVKTVNAFVFKSLLRGGGAPRNARQFWDAVPHR